MSKKLVASNLAFQVFEGFLKQEKKVFDRSVNPISTRGGADYTHHITTSPPGFSDLATGLC